jgi:hypothetical protein
MQNKLLETHVTALQHWVLASPLLLRLFAIATVVFELGFVFVILFPRARLVAAVVGFGFHESTALLMDIRFPALQAAYVVFVPWSRYRAWLRRVSHPAVRTSASPAEGAAELGRAASPLALRITAAALLSAVTLAGALHLVRTWPIACYPTFDIAAVPNVDDVVIVARDVASGTETWTLSFDSTMGAHLGTDRWRGLLSTFTDPKVPFDPARGRALVTAWGQVHPLPALRTATFMVETHSLTLRTESPLKQRILGEVSFRDDSAATATALLLQKRSTVTATALQLQKRSTAAALTSTSAQLQER